MPIHELVLFKEMFCPVCLATDLLILRDPQIQSRFLVTRLEKNANQGTKLMQHFWWYADQVGAEIYPTIMLGRTEDDFYPFVFHIWKKGKPKPVELSESERKHLLELKQQILDIDKEFTENPVRIPKAYVEWKKTFGLEGI
jgi:hypothetical protein